MLYIAQQGMYEAKRVIGVYSDLGLLCASFGITPDQLQEDGMTLFYTTENEFDIDYRMLVIFKVTLNTPRGTIQRFDQ